MCNPPFRSIVGERSWFRLLSLRTTAGLQTVTAAGMEEATDTVVVEAADSLP
jgi:hypothetical protein